MSKTRLLVRTILRIVRSMLWYGLAGFAIYTTGYIENLLRRDRLGLPQLVFSLTELVACLCAATGLDRALSLAEKLVDEAD